MMECWVKKGNEFEFIFLIYRIYQKNHILQYPLFQYSSIPGHLSATRPVNSGLTWRTMFPKYPKPTVTGGRLDDTIRSIEKRL